MLTQQDGLPENITTSTRGAGKLFCLDPRPRLLQEEGGNVPPVPPPAPNISSGTHDDLAALKYLFKVFNLEKTSLQVGKNCFVLTYSIKVGEQSIVLFLFIFIEAALRRTATCPCEYTRSCVFTVPMHSCVFLKRYHKHWLDLRGEVYGPTISSENGSLLKWKPQISVKVGIQALHHFSIYFPGICSIISSFGL